MAQEPAVVKGIYETQPKDFAVKAKSQKDVAVVVWDLKEVVPDLFKGTDNVSRTLHQIWREVLDHITREETDGGSYCSGGGTQVKVFFEGLNEAKARAKLDTASQEVKKAVQAKMKTESGGANDEGGDQAPQEKKKVGGDEALAAVIQEGLKDNASFREVNFWADRLVQDIQIAGKKNAMPQELLKNAKNVKCVFYPVWNAAAQAVAGNFAAVGKVTDITGETKALRQDLALLTWTCMEALRLVKEGVQTLVILPLSINSLKEKAVYDLYINILRHMDPGVHKLLVFEVRDLPKGVLTPTIKEKIQALMQYCRTVIVNTGILSLQDYASPEFQPHAYGFDLAEFNLPEEEACNKMHKYGEVYQKKQMKTFAKNVTSPKAAKIAKEAGFLYIAGPALVKPLPKCVGVKKVSLEQLLQGSA